MDKLVSIIVPCRNEERVIERLLSSVKAQTYPYIETIVVDNNSSDQTKSIAKKFTSYVYNFGPERSAQRNFGAKKARGEYLLFLDADMELTSDVLRDCVRVCNIDKKIGGVVIPEESKTHNFWEKVKAFERFFYNKSGDETTDAARFFRKETFVKVGGYDETITGPEDWDLPETIEKRGFNIGRVTSLIYHYERIKSPFDLARKKYYYALTAHRYLKKQNISTFSPKTIYFLRPVFYKNFDKILAHPVLSIGMLMMLTMELFGGGLGYLIGRIKRL